MLNRYRKSGQPCLVPYFSGIALSFSPLSLMLAVSLLYIAFIMYRYVPCIPALSKTSIMKWSCILSKAFLASNEMIMCFFFQFVYMVDCVDRFLYVEQSLHLCTPKSFKVAFPPSISGLKLKSLTMLEILIGQGTR